MEYFFNKYRFSGICFVGLQAVMAKITAGSKTLR
jgi:hypothetical protein